MRSNGLLWVACRGQPAWPGRLSLPEVITGHRGCQDAGWLRSTVPQRDGGLHEGDSVPDQEDAILDQLAIKPTAAG